MRGIGVEMRGIRVDIQGIWGWNEGDQGEDLPVGVEMMNKSVER